MRGIKSGLVVLGILGLCHGCAGTTPSTAGHPGAFQSVQQAPIHYRCSDCGAKIPRDATAQKGFIEQCPRCGKKFIMM